MGLDWLPDCLFIGKIVGTMNTVLVTGSEGNIGAYIVKRLLEKPDIRVVRVGRKPRQAENYHAGDLRDPNFVKTIFSNYVINYVIHGAAENYSAALLKSDPYGILQNDPLSTLNVLNASRGVKKFVFLSSSSIYESVEKAPFEETPVSELPMPKSPIGIAKFFGERAIEMFAAQFGIKYTIWRGFNIVSPLEPHEGAGGHVFVDFYRKLLVEKQSKLEIFGNPAQVRCFMWVEDAAAAIADYLMDDRTDNQIFNLGSSEQKTLMDVVNILTKVGGIDKPLIETAAATVRDAQKPKNSVADLRKAEKVLGWKAATSFEECFRK